GGVFGDTPAGLPNSQLAVLPGTSHVTVVYRADLLLAIIPPFLDAPMPEPKTSAATPKQAIRQTGADKTGNHEQWIINPRLHFVGRLSSYALYDSPLREQIAAMR